MVAVLAIVVVVLLIALGIVLSYNRFVTQRGAAEDSWRQVDVELQRRHDLIGALLTVTRAGGGIVGDRLAQIVQARSQAMASAGAGPVARGQAEQVLTGALSSFLTAVEGVAALRTNRDFCLLRQQIAECDERVAGASRCYNDRVRAFNARIDSFPTSILAGAAKFAKAQYYSQGGSPR